VAAATTPAPLPASEPDEAQQGSGIIPGDRPEFPLPTLNDKHSFLATPRGIDRPRTPPELSFEDSRALLTRLTGLQPWQLEAFPDELPPLPLSRPSSPLRSPETSRPPPQVRPRRLSSTAVPIRFRKPPLSPSTQRELALEPEKRSVSPGTSPVRSRHSKAHSAEFRTSREIRPLYLLERNRKSGEIDEVLPALPSSASPSRASSSTDTDAEYESALESPRPSDNVTPDDLNFDPLHAVSDLIAGRPGPELQHPELVGREIEEVDGSGQVTPKASDFTSGTPAASVGPSRDVLAAALEDVKAKRSSSRPASPLAPSAPLDDTKMRDVSTTRSGKSSPTNSSSRLQTAAFGAAIGGLTAAAFRNRTPSPFEVLTGGRRLSEERKIETESAPVSSEPDEMEIDRDTKGKGKASRDMSVSEPSVAAPPQKVSEPKQAVPTFVDSEDDWAKNKSESIVTDDATLVGESTSGPSASKELQTEKILESTAPQAAQSIDVRRATFGSGDKSSDEPTSKSAASPADLEKALADIEPEQEPVQTIAEDVASSTPKGKKKKNKKGKRGSQQVEAEPSSLPIEPAQEDKIIPEPETQKETIEREILEPSFPSASQVEKKVDVMDFLGKDDQDAAPEFSAAVEVQKKTTPVPSVVEPAVPVADIPVVEVKELEQPKFAATETPAAEPERPTSGWGSGLWGALGWGKKRATSPAPTPTAAPVVEEKEKKETEVPPVPVVTSESKQPEIETEVKTAKPELAQEVAAVSDEVPIPEATTAPTFVVPETAYFADGGKPHFTFPQPSNKVTEDSAREPTEDVIVKKGLDAAPAASSEPTSEVYQEAKPTYATAPSPTAFFTDNGKPHFTFPQPSVKNPEEVSQATSNIIATEKAQVETPSGLPVASEYVSRGLTTRDFTPPTPFFTDNGKPHFTFPQPSTKSAEAVTPEPESILAAKAVAPAEPTESSMSKKKKSKKDKKKRESVVAPELESVGSEPSTTTAGPSQAPDVGVDDQQVQQRSEDLVTAPLAVDEAAVLLRDTQPNIVPVDVALPENTKLTEKDVVPEPQVENAEKTLELPQKAAPADTVPSTPAEEDAAPSSSKKKIKKAKKAKQESVQLPTVEDSEPSTSVVERSFNFSSTAPSEAKPDASIDVPLPMETLTEKDELTEPIVEPVKETPVFTQPKLETAVQDGTIQPVESTGPVPTLDEPASAERDITETALPVTEDELAATPKKKKGKKSKAKSGTQTPEVQAKPIVEPSTSTAELAEPSRDVVEMSKDPTEPTQLSEPTTSAVAPPLEQTKSLEVEPTPVEQQSREDISAAIEPSAEAEEATLISKKDKKKKKGKKAKGTETPVEETVLPEVTTTIDTVGEPSVQPENIGLPDELDGELEAPVEETTVQPQAEPETLVQADTKEIALSTEDTPAAPQPDIPSEPVSRDITDLTTDNSTVPKPAPIEESTPTPVVVQPTDTAEADDLASTPSKKDKKKKKGKKNKAVDESGPSTPVTEVQRELEAPIQSVQPEPTVKTDVAKPEQPLEGVAQPTLTPEVATVAEEKPIEALTEPESARDLRAIISEEPIQAPATDVVEEAATESKKAKKKKGKKGKSVDIEPSAADLPKETVESESVIEPPVVEKGIEAEPAPLLEESQEAPLPLETPKEPVTEPVEVVKETEDQPTPVLVESTRDIEEPVVEEESATPKKSKKKKAKKGKSLDTEPSTPISEEPPVLVKDSSEPALTERSDDILEVQEQAPSNKEENSAKEPESVAGPAPVSAIVDDATLSAVEKPVQDTAVSSALESTVEPTVGPHIEPTVEPTVETTIEPAVEAEGAELASTKKSKKKKAKKAKSTDITEPSTPTTEEPSVQFEAPSEPVAVEKSSDGVAQPPIDEPIPGATTVPTVDESLSRTVSKAEENTDVPTERASQDAVEPPMLLEPAAEEAVGKSTPKKAKKKMGKKAKADEEKEPETVAEAVKDAPIVGPSPEAAQVEETVHRTESLVAEAPVKSISLADDTLPTPLAEEPIERELATEMGQSSEPVDFEVPMENISAEFEALSEDPLSTERSEPQIEGPQNDDATSTSKKTKKKKGKKSKSISEPQTPVTEVESFIAATTETPEAQATPALVELTTTTEEVALPEIETAKPTETQDVEQTLIEAIQLTEELSRDNEPSVTVADQPAEQVGESTTDAPLSKKDKKKAKKGKRVSIVEDTASATAAPVEEVTRELGSEEHATEVPRPQREIATISEPVSPKSMPVSTTQQEDVVPTTLNDSNLAEPTSIGETIAPADSEGASAEQRQKKTVEPEPTPAVEEDATSSKKGKKKAKKDKRKSVTESEPSTPLETPTQELERAPLDKEPFAIPEVVAESKEEDVSTAVDLEPATTTPMPEENTSVVTEVKQEEQPSVEPVLAEEPQQPEQSAEPEQSSLSKKDKKRAKKSKRVSIAEPESTPATPTEEKEVSLEDQPLPVAQLPEPAQGEAVSSSIEVQPVITETIEEQKVVLADVEAPLVPATAEEDQQPQQTPEEESLTISKKEKKKAKKAKRVSIAEPESEVATPSEEKKELELPVEEPVAPIPAATEEATPAVTPVKEPISRDLPIEDSAPVAPVVEESSLPQTPAEEPTAAPVEEEAPTSVSKKDKKKAKKAKRGSVAESGITTPIETPVEEKAQDPLEVQEPQSAPAVEEQISETPATEEPVLVAPPADDLQKAVDAEATVTSSKDKKKSKKAKRGSIPETEPSEPSTPIEVSTPEVVDAKVEDHPATTASDVNEPVIVAPVGPQPAVALTESIAPESTEQVPEQIKDVLAEDQPLTTPPVVEEPIVAVPEVSQIDMPSTVTEEKPKDIVQDDAPSESTPKKDRKKAKKSKRGSIAEPELSEPSAPVEQVPEQTKDVGVEEQQTVAPSITEEPAIVSPIVKEELPQPSLDQEVLLPATLDESKEPSQAIPPTEPLSSEAVSETAAAPVEQTKDDEAEPAEWAILSKAQKKKLKKAKRASVAESEPSQPATPAEELTKELRVEAVQPVTETADLKEPIVAPVVDESTVIAEQPEASSTVQEPVEAVEEPVVKSKKEKKKAKKSKASSVIEGELSQPATPTEEVSRELAPSFEQPVVPDADEIAGEQKPAEGQSVTVTPVEEPQTEPIVEAPVEAPVEPTPAVEETADATLSKKDKKKAKRSKRASGIEDQTSLPATPVEEFAKELGIDDQPSTSAATEQQTTDEPPAAHDTPPPGQATEEAPATATFIEPVEEPTKPSKKDKKKAKKQQKESKSETVPFLALETPEEANVSDTQSSPPPSIPSETPLLLSGIPTSYPHVRDIAFVENGGESVQDESARVVDEKEMEKKLDVDVEKQEEPVVEAVDEQKTKKTKTDKKGKKRASVVEDPLPEASSAVDVADTTPIEPSESEQVRSVATLDPEVVVIEQPIAQVDPAEAQLHDSQPIEEVKAAPEEKTTTMPSEPEQKKVKKHKLAALFEQKAAEDKPILSRKRTPLAKSTPETIATEPTGESSKEVKVDELVATAQLEPIVSIDDTAKPSEEFTFPKSIVKPGASTPAISDVVMDKPLEPTERALDPVDEQPKEPTPVPTETVLDAESLAAAKKDKKKAKKDKKKSGTAIPVEAVPDVPDAAEEPLTSKTEETSLEAAPLVDKNVPVKAEEQSQEISEVIQAQPIVTDTPRDISVDLSQEKSIEVETPSEPPTAVNDEVITTPSKKEKKKNKKAKKQSGTATPADEALSEAQPEKVEVPPVQASEQIVDQPAVIKAAPVVEEAPALIKENIKSRASDKTIAFSQEEASAVVVDPVADIPSQQEEVQQPTASVPEEAVEPIEDTDVKLSKKDKKKSKKSSGIDTPMVEDVPEVEQKVEEPAMEQVKAVVPSQVTEAEPVVERTNEALAETIPTTLGKAIETPPREEAPTVETEVATDALEHVPATDMPDQPAEEDWGYTPPKKDKKKGKKAKKAEEVATIVESVSRLPNETAETMESTTTPEKTIQDTVEAQPVQVTETDAVRAEDTNEKNLESERALDIAETDITEVAPLPAPELPAEAPIEEEAPAPSKKDKKKAKKAKKASGTATPVTEEIAVMQPEQVQEHTADNVDSVTESIEEVPAAISRKELVVEQPREVEQEPIPSVVAIPAPLIDQSALPPSATKEEAQKSEEAFPEDGPAIPADITHEPTIAATDANKSLVDEPPVAATQEDFVTTDTRGVERPAQDSAATVEVEPLDKGLTPEASKKSKKKDKKSGTATPITEDVPAPEPELSRDLGIQPKPATNVKDDIMEDVQPSAAQTQPILEEQSRIEQLDTPVVSQLTELVTAIDEHAPASTPKKTKKKSKMSGTPTPTVDDTVVPQQETTQELQDTPMLVESVDTSTSESRYDVEVTRDVEIQEADIPHATVEPEPQPDPTPQLEEDIAPTSLKKSKKKAKKSDTPASITKGVPQVASEDVPPPVEEPIATDRNVQESTVHALDVPDAKDDTPATIEPVLAPEPELEAPIDFKPEHNGLAVSEDLAIAPELVTEDTTSTPSKKKKRNKSKKSEPPTPAIELSDPMATETRMISEDVHQAPVSEVTEVAFHAPVPEPLVLADKVPSETRGEVIVEEKPVLSRKLSKKEKRARKSSIAMDVKAEPIAESEMPTESIVEASQAPTIEPSIIEEPRQLPIIKEPEVPALTAEPIHPVEHAEQTVPTVDNPVAAPMQDEIPTAITQEETVSTPVKGKKSKKDKKSKKQSMSLDTVEAVEIAESGPNEQARDDAKPLIEPSQEKAVVRDLDPSLATSNEVTDVPALELSEAIEAPLPQVLGNVEQVPERQATLGEPEVGLQPHAEENSEPMPTVDIEPTEVTGVPNRKASKKTKKGKKSNDILSEQEQPEAAAVAEPTVESVPQDLASTTEQLDVPAPSESSNQELQMTTTTIDLTPSDIATGPHSQLIEQENETVLATVEMVNEASTSAQPLEDPMSIADETEVTTPSKKSKKDKKGKKSSLTSGITTPIEVVSERSVAPSEITATETTESTVLDEQPRDARPIEPEAIVRGGPSDTQPPQEVTSTPAVATIQDTPLPAREIAQEQERQTIEADEPSLSRSASEKGKKKGKKVQNAPSELEEGIATTESELLPVTARESPKEEVEVLPIITEARREAERSPPPPSFQTTQADSEPMRGIVEPAQDQVTQVQERQDDKEELSRPPTISSPDLKAVQDDVVEFKLRSEALDQALATQEQLDEPTSSDPTSFFDVVGKLSKKDKKKGKKAKGASLDTEPTTPTAGPEAVVETKEILEEPRMAEIPSRKLSKKDKKKAKQSIPEVEEVAERLPEQLVPIIETQQPLIDQSREEANIFTETTTAKPAIQPDAPVVPVEQTQPTPLEEPVHPSEEVAAMTKEASRVNDTLTRETETIEPLVRTETQHTDLAASVIEAPKAQPDMPPEAESIAEEERPSVSRKLSKKDKKKGKKSASIDEPTKTEQIPEVAAEKLLRTEELPIESQQPDVMNQEIPVVDFKATEKEAADTVHTPVEDTSVLQQSAVESVVYPEPTPAIAPEIAAENESAVPSKKSKKEKRKPKPTAESDVLPDAGPTPISQAPVEEHLSQQVVEVAEPEIEPALKPSKKEKRKSKKTAPAFEAESTAPLDTERKPEHPKEAVSERTETVTAPARVVDDQSTRVAVIRDAEPSSSTTSLDTAEAPTLAKKPSRAQKLAALFEQGASQEGSSGQRELRKGTTGSVKDLAKQYETQSRSVTPIQLPTSERRTVSRVTSDARLGSRSPKKDIDFAGTVAAGLKISGFDDTYVVNDSTFHQSTSPHGTRDMTTDDDVAAALNSAGASKFASQGWTTPTSSPKLRPTKESDSSTLPPIEVAVAATDDISFDPLDVLNDPTFSKSNTSPRALEEADPDELGSKLKMNKKSSGKKKRTSLPESSAEAVPTTLLHEPTGGVSRSVELQSLDAQSKQLPTEHDSAWPSEPKKDKKVNKDKKRASRTQDSVEYAVAETPAVEALTREPPVVETLAVDSTACESKFAKPLSQAPINVAPVDQGLPKEQAPKRATGKDFDEYPFPQVPIPRDAVSRDMEKSPMVGRKETEEVEESVGSSKKKDKESKKGKEKSEPRSEMQEEVHHNSSVDRAQNLTTETHKRRSHPVTFEEDQPYEKRTHLREATPELRQATSTKTKDSAGNERTSRRKTSALDVEPRGRGLSPSAEPSLSFAGVRDSTVEVDELPVQARPAPFQESTRDSGYHDAGHSPVMPQEPIQQETTSSREKKRKSKEPKTPRERAIRNSQDVENSPTLPEYPASAGATTPSPQEYATKERTSYLFDSSPSTRAYGTSPTVETVTPAHESRRAVPSTAKEIGETTRSSKKPHAGSRDEQLSPTKEIEPKEPYQSIFGDSKEKSTGQSSSLVTPLSKHGRTPSNNQLHTITETSPPDDSPLHKKGRAINDVGAPDRGTKSARRTESPKPFSERLKSPPPVTPTPLSRRGVPAASDSTGRASASIESPWSQVHDNVDRTMTLSPARRMPRSSPSYDPIKQQMAEQRSASALSQRSMSNISKFRSPDQEQRPLSSASNRSTQSLRRVDRSASGDLRAVSRLGEASAQDAKETDPNLSSLALATGAAAAIAGIADASKYDPVRGTGKGRRASMAAETFVSPQT
jgi:hypothetical protein